MNFKKLLKYFPPGVFQAKELNSLIYPLPFALCLALHKAGFLEAGKMEIPLEHDPNNVVTVFNIKPEFIPQIWPRETFLKTSFPPEPEQIRLDVFYKLEGEVPELFQYQNGENPEDNIYIKRADFYNDAAAKLFEGAREIPFTSVIANGEFSEGDKLPEDLLEFFNKLPQNKWFDPEDYQAEIPSVLSFCYFLEALGYLETGYISPSENPVLHFRVIDPPFFPGEYRRMITDEAGKRRVALRHAPPSYKEATNIIFFNHDPENAPEVAPEEIEKVWQGIEKVLDSDDEARRNAIIEKAIKETPEFSAFSQNFPGQTNNRFALEGIAEIGKGGIIPVRFEAMAANITQERIISEFRAERILQDKKFGEQNHFIFPQDVEYFRRPAYYSIPEQFAAKRTLERALANGKLTFFDVLIEEVAEAAEAKNIIEVRQELVQVGAVSLAMIEAIDRNAGKPGWEFPSEMKL